MRVVARASTSNGSPTVVPRCWDFDISDKTVRLAKQRVGTRAQVWRVDLGKPLDFLADASFDIVLSALALDYVEDWEQVFREFHRVLRQPGHLIFSVGHPF